MRTSAVVVAIVLLGCSGARRDKRPPVDTTDAAVVTKECVADIARLRQFLDEVMIEGRPEIPMPRLVALEVRARRRDPHRQRLIEITAERAWAAGSHESIAGSDGWLDGNLIDPATLVARIGAVIAAEPPPAGAPIAFRIYAERGVAWSRVVTAIGAAHQAGVVRAEWMFDGTTTLEEPGPAIPDLPDLSTQLGMARYMLIEKQVEDSGLARDADAWEPAFWRAVADTLEREGCPVPLAPLRRWVWEMVAYRVGDGVPRLAIVTTLAGPGAADAVTITAPATARWDDVVPRLVAAEGKPIRLAVGKAK